MQQTAVQFEIQCRSRQVLWRRHGLTGQAELGRHTVTELCPWSLALFGLVTTHQP